MPMDRPREQLFPRAAFADQQDPDHRQCRAVGKLHGALQPRTLREDPAVTESSPLIGRQAVTVGSRRSGRPSRAAQSLPDLTPPDRLPHHQGDFPDVAAFLDDVVRRPELHGFDRHGLRPGAGDHHDRQVGMSQPHPAQRLEPARVRQTIIEQHAVEAAAVELLEGFTHRRCCRDVERAGGAQAPGDQLGGLGVILDDEHPNRHAGEPSRTPSRARAGHSRARASPGSRTRRQQAPPPRLPATGSASRRGRGSTAAYRPA